MENTPGILKKIEDLVREIVSDNNIPLCKITSGYECHSLQAAEPSAEVPTIRIVSFFGDVAVQLAQLLEQEFELAAIVTAADAHRSWADGLSKSNASYMARLKENRRALPEYRKWADTPFELQIVTVLQHALTNVEQHLGFNNADHLPDELKRDFYRVGALLEMADIELQKIRRQCAAISAPAEGPKAPEKPVTAAVAVPVVAPQKQAIEPAAAPEPQPAAEAAPVPAPTPQPAPIPEPPRAVAREESGTLVVAVPVASNSEPSANGASNGAYGKTQTTQELLQAVEANSTDAYIAPDSNTAISYASLRDFVKTSTLLREVDAQIAAHAGARLNDEIDIDGDVERLQFLQVYSLKELHERILENKQDMVAFASRWIGKDNGGSFDSGIGLFYLEYVLVAKRNDPQYAVEYVLKFISDNDYSARYIIPTYSSIKAAEKTGGQSFATIK